MASELEHVADDKSGIETSHESQPSSAEDNEPANNQETEFAVKEGDFLDDSDPAAQLAALATGVRDQDDLERDIGRQADQLLLEQADERDRKRAEKTQKSKDILLSQIRALERKLTEFGNSATQTKHRSDILDYQTRIASLDEDLAQINKRIGDRQKSLEDANTSTEQVGNHRMPGESEREFLIRTGKITPFSKKGRQLLKASSSLGDVLLDAEEEAEHNEDGGAEEEDEGQTKAGPISHRNLLAPGFESEDSTTISAGDDTGGDEELARKLQEEEFSSSRPSKRRRLDKRQSVRRDSEEVEDAADESDPAYTPATDADGMLDSEDLIEGENVTDGEDGILPTTPGIKRKGKRRVGNIASTEDEIEDLAGIDDGNEDVYKARLESWNRRRRAAREKFREQAQSTNQELDPQLEDALNSARAEEDEAHMPHPSRTDSAFEGGFRIPGDIYPSLFDYQKTGVQWLWELYSQQVGGIIGDEMGLGKTVQVISFLAGLHYSKKVTRPIIVVCPATVMKQWVNEFHRWWPPLRVSILHTSGSGMLNVKREARIEDDLEDSLYRREKRSSKVNKPAKRVVDKVLRDGHVLVTTYSGLQTYRDLLLPVEWEYAVLDEGHKIRNPDANITVFCKMLQTHNRLILSGTPMQNNLTELWSLFDFVFPMRLGDLVSFRMQFEVPIKQGGYANASNLQVETAMRCAETLKDAISPYLLQRFKVDVAADLPKKSERVLFCKLTKLQRDAYEWFLNSDDMKSIMAGRRQALYGVDILRKICNHPDLVEHRTLSKKIGYNYGIGTKSGKMQVVKALLEIWKRNGHKTLLFAQHRIMLDILERFVQGMDGVNYRRMDGNTSIKDRQDLVDEFNKNQDLHVFLLTTKVGGLGVNLTGADRVIIYDPDWNPSTDIQARERAWRLGQKREVEIYRLMTAGTIEEKIYHRQIFKQFLTNKILKDPKQRQTFQLKDLHDLFTLGDSQDGQTETGSIFKGTEVRLSKARNANDDDGQPREPGELAEGSKAAIDKVVGVSRQEDYQGSAHEESDSANGEQDSGGKSDRMLSTIFARTGVQSALEHDAIINGTKSTRADPEIIAREARKVAAQAARELQKAGEIARTVPAGVPTWTGQTGTFGRPPSPPPRRGGMMAGRGGRGGRGGGGPSSSSVLANLQARQLGNGFSPASSSRASTPGRGHQDQPKGKDFMALIRDYLIAHGGSAYTQMLIDHFNRYCGSEQRTAEFKEMLKTVAVMEKGGRGRAKWVLKESFRPGKRSESSK
ncbi:Hypothetical protein R9X50_00571800 [Acrodontium crateriforme]|uniref:DNA repair protein Rhp26/Rad26 n=1 Tax=Acrodontium crateriforme TaxID=150365 RepID=A0AAQ3RBQ6_9PEZI|nr:Hypothetical protein R9X50_00571800 [Acrodontium crateriforme]